MARAKYGKEAAEYWAKRKSKIKGIMVAIAVVTFALFMYWYNIQV